MLVGAPKSTLTGRVAGTGPVAAATVTKVILVLIPFSGRRVSRPSVTATVTVPVPNLVADVGVNGAIATWPSTLTAWVLS